MEAKKEKKTEKEKKGKLSLTGVARLCTRSELLPRFQKRLKQKLPSKEGDQASFWSKQSFGRVASGAGRGRNLAEKGEGPRKAIAGAREGAGSLGNIPRQIFIHKGGVCRRTGSSPYAGRGGGIHGLFNNINTDF